jgi:hypothetical protein
MAIGDNNTGNPYSQQDVQRTEQVTSLARTLTEELKDQLGIRSRLNETEKAQLNLARQVQRSAAENTIELGNQGSIGRQIIKDQKLLLKVLNEKRTLEKTTNNTQKDRARAIFQTQSSIQKIQDDLLQASGEEADTLLRRLNTQEGILRGILRTADAETQRLALAYGMEDATKTIIGQRENEAEIQKEINERMGVSGALVKGTGALMERLGMRSGIFNDAMKDSQEEMQRMAEESTRLVEIADENGNITKKTLENHSKTAIMLAGMRKLGQGFGQALFDPFTIATGILTAFLDVNKAGVEFTRVTGQSTSTLAGTVTESSNLVDLLKTATELTKQTGLNAATIFSPDQIGQLSDAKNLLGISAEQAGNLGLMMKLTGESADQLGNAIYDNVDAGVSQKMVYDDVLSASKDIVASAGGNTEELGKAASAARKLGMDLAKVNQIADGLMDFESSISAELEAQLLTGKNINLAKARELALNNDLEGVAEELAKNGASAAEFAKMNRIQQQALAEALGMSREELGKMVLTEEALADMTDEQRAAARGVTLEQSKQMDIQEKIGKLTSNFLQSFSPLLEAFMPVVDILIDGLKAAMFVLTPLIEGFRLIGDLVDYMVEGVKKGEGPAIALAAAVGALVSPLIVSAIGGIFTAFSQIPFGIGIPLAITAVAGMMSLISKNKKQKVQDGVATSKNGPFEITDSYGRTAITATGDNLAVSPNLSMGGNTPTMDTKALEAKLDRLIAAVTAGGNVYLDGNKVGSAQVLGTYKSS